MLTLVSILQSNKSASRKLSSEWTSSARLSLVWVSSLFLAFHLASTLILTIFSFSPGKTAVFVIATLQQIEPVAGQVGVIVL
jgi:hypothetical protein